MQSSKQLKPPTTETYDSLLAPGQSLNSVTTKISDIILFPVLKTPVGWIVGFVAAGLLLMLYLYSLAALFTYGIGIWGINIPVAWGFDIINFVWWIGIGHAGTLISAILLLFRQDWRTSINRAAEAMTIFAVACAGIYPLIHTGRPWLDYWFLPYPSTLGMWPQFRSPLEWDVFAISTYATVSVLFWFVGLVPDLATLRDRSTSPIAKNCMGCSRSVGVVLPSTGSAMKLLHCCWQVCRHRWYCRFTPSSRSTLPLRNCLGGT